MTIHILDELTINQMAAGEVIENTSSVIKELVENSLDAHASFIEVEVQSGGRSYIRVSDNGDGILSSEVPKAILRHATSKLLNLSDLERLQTLGFRGEALASIASISRLSITTSTSAPTSSTPNGSYFVAEGGQTVTHVDVYREKGTTIEVKDLFYNTPVRKAFQRSSIYDTQDIVKTLTHLALGYPSVGFRLIADKKRVLDLEPKPLHERSNDCLGYSSAKALPIETTLEGVKIQGLLFPPSEHRHNRMGQYLLLNHRPIFSNLISQAVKEGYGHALPEGRYPLFVLDVVLDSKMIDVNVHPQKREARFRSKGNLSYNITKAVQECLFKQKNETFTPPTYFDPIETVVVKESPLSKMVWSAPVETREFSLPEKQVQPFLFEPARSVPKIVGSIEGYLIIEDEGLQIVNLVAVFEHLFKINKLPKAASIPLLIPIEMEVSQELILSLEELNPLLKKLCIEVTPFSAKSILIHTCPTHVKEKELFDLIHEVFQQWKEGATPSKSGQILGKRKLGIQEAEYLLETIRDIPSKNFVFPLTKDLLDQVVYANQ